MYPQTIDEVNRLLASGNITPEQAQMYVTRINSSNPSTQYPELFTQPSVDIFPSSQANLPLTQGQYQFTVAPGPAAIPPTSGTNGQGMNLFQLTPQTNSLSLPANGEYNYSPAAGQGQRPMTDFTSKQDYVDYMNQQGYDRTTAAQNWDEVNGAQAGTTPNGNQQGFLPYLYPGGTDFSSELFTLGRALGTEKGTNGRGLAIAGASGSLLFGAARNVASGIGYAKTNEYVNDWYRDQQFGAPSRNYTPAPQYQNTNTLGGFYAEDGGQQMMQSQQGPDQMQQMIAGISQAMQQGATEDQIMASLMQQGMRQQQAIQLIQMATQQQSPETPEQTLTMRDGGAFKYKVGDPITFEAGGKMHSGVISKIENGQIYL